MSQEELVNEPQAKPAELSAAALKEEYSAMRKRLAQAELQIDKMRFGGGANKQPQESVRQEAWSLRKKLEEQYDLDASGTYTSLQNREQKREVVCAQQSVEDQDGAPSRGVSAKGGETASDGDSRRGGTSGQVDNSITNDDAISCDSQTLSSSSGNTLTPDSQLRVLRSPTSQCSLRKPQVITDTSQIPHRKREYKSTLQSP